MCFKWNIRRLIESITNNSTSVLISTQNCGIYPVIQHGDSQLTALEEWITFSKAKYHIQNVNE